MDQSTFALLEHINFNVPTYDLAIPFYYDILGCGADPRMADNLDKAVQLMDRNKNNEDKEDNEEKKQQKQIHAKEEASSVLFDATIWANCGASQFHLCYNDQTPATIPGRIGLRYESLDGLEKRLNEHVFEVLNDRTKQCFQSFIQERDSQGNPQITVVDRYNNIFVCRTVNGTAVPHESSPVEACQQPILAKEAIERYGRSETECLGIDYVEIPVKPGQAERIAEFYEAVFDATVSVVPQPPQPQDDPLLINDKKIAMIAIGNIMETGRADQYLLFKEEEETNDPFSLLQAGHHHMAIYVGESVADFEQAYKNADQAGIVWINPRFEDKVDTLAAAQKEQQFRFKSIVDLETGKPLLELEHEIRSRDHPSWPGH